MAQPGSIVILTDRAPLYVARFVGVVDDAAFQAYLDETLRLTRLGRHAMVYDARRAGMTPRSQRKMQSDWMREHDKLNRETTVAIGFVLPNPLLRGLLTAMLYVHPMPCPHRVTASVADAELFCERRLRGGTQPGAVTP